MGFVCENMRKIDRTKMRMLRLMCAIRLQEKLLNADLRSRFGVECIVDVVRSSRLCWLGHVECKPEEEWVKNFDI